MAKDRAKGMLISVDIRQQVEMLSNEEAGELFKALLAYADDGTPMSTDNRLLSIVFAGLRTQLDAAAEMYATRCEKNRAAAAERWKRKSANASERMQMDANACECIQTHTNASERMQMDAIKENKRKENKYINKATKVAMEKTDGANAPHSALLDVNAYVAYFNEQLVAHGAIIKRVAKVTPLRRSVIEARARENGKEALKTVADKAAASDFLNAKNDRGWLATFDWIMRPNNFVKVLEGNFDNKTMAASNGGKNVNDLWQ